MSGREREGSRIDVVDAGAPTSTPLPPSPLEPARGVWGVAAPPLEPARGAWGVGERQVEHIGRLEAEDGALGQ